MYRINRERRAFPTRETCVGADSTAPAGAFRRPTGPQVRLLGRRYPPGLRRRRVFRADMESAPTWVCNHARFAFSRLAATFIPVRRGGIYPSRGRLRRGEVPGTMQASSPTLVCGIAGFVVSPLAASFIPVRRGGIYCARRRVSEANRRAAAALRPEIPPAGVCSGAGCGGMRASRPTVVPYVPHQPGAPRVSDARNAM